MSVTNTCPTCGEEFHPSQRYYAGPYKEHVQCRKVRELGLEVGAAYHEKQTTQHKSEDTREE